MGRRSLTIGFLFKDSNLPQFWPYSTMNFGIIDISNILFNIQIFFLIFCLCPFNTAVMVILSDGWTTARVVLSNQLPVVACRTEQFPPFRTSCFHADEPPLRKFATTGEEMEERMIENMKRSRRSSKRRRMKRRRRSEEVKNGRFDPSKKEPC